MIVVDNANDHNLVVQGKSTTNSRKADTQQWIRRHEVQFDGGTKKSELIWLVDMHLSTTVYHTDVIADAADLNVFLLAIEHC